MNSKIICQPVWDLGGLGDISCQLVDTFSDTVSIYHFLILPEVPLIPNGMGGFKSESPKSADRWQQPPITKSAKRYRMLCARTRSRARDYI